MHRQSCTDGLDGGAEFKLQIARETDLKLREIKDGKWDFAKVGKLAGALRNKMKLKLLNLMNRQRKLKIMSRQISQRNKYL